MTDATKAPALTRPRTSPRAWRRATESPIELRSPTRAETVWRNGIMRDMHVACDVIQSVARPAVRLDR